MSGVIVKYRHAGPELIDKLARELGVLCSRLTGSEISIQFVQAPPQETITHNIVVNVRLPGFAHLAHNSRRDAMAILHLVVAVIDSFDVFILEDGPFSDVGVSLSYQPGHEVEIEGTSTDLPFALRERIDSPLGEYIAAMTMGRCLVCRD